MMTSETSAVRVRRVFLERERVTETIHLALTLDTFFTEPRDTQVFGKHQILGSACHTLGTYRNVIAGRGPVREKLQIGWRCSHLTYASWSPSDWRCLISCFHCLRDVLAQVDGGADNFLCNVNPLYDLALVLDNEKTISPTILQCC
jgi:hypothetical protein